MNSFRLNMVLMASLCVSGSIFFAAPVYCGDLPKKGDILPPMELQAPSSEKEMAYLGITGQTFRLGDIPCKLLLLEVIGVYCPACYRQAPLFNTLFNRIEKGKLEGQVKMVAVAAGGSVPELQYLKEQGLYYFPVAPDPSFTAHKLLGEPRTPFTLLVNPQGKVLHTHLGVVEDIDAFQKLITGLVH